MQQTRGCGQGGKKMNGSSQREVDDEVDKGK